MAGVNSSKNARKENQPRQHNNLRGRLFVFVEFVAATMSNRKKSGSKPKPQPQPPKQAPQPANQNALTASGDQKQQAKPKPHPQQPKPQPQQQQQPQQPKPPMGGGKGGGSVAGLQAKLNIPMGGLIPGFGPRPKKAPQPVEQPPPPQQQPQPQPRQISAEPAAQPISPLAATVVTNAPSNVAPRTMTKEDEEEGTLIIKNSVDLLSIITPFNTLLQPAVVLCI
jgi:outer membrane biosynthesis protein TonB